MGNSGVRTIPMSLAVIAMLAGCGQKKMVNVFTVFNDNTLTCDIAAKMVSALPDTDSMYRAAASKVSYCEAESKHYHGNVIVGRFNTTEKLYEFELIDWNNAVDVRRLCLDIGVAGDIVDVGPAEMLFETTWDTFTCDWLPAKLAEKDVAVLIAPAHLPLLIGVDAVIVFATGANPRLEGVPPRFYPEVTDLLKKAIDEFDDQG